LGAAWAVLQPAMMMAVFTVFLRWMAGVPSGDCPYPLFAYLGFLPWSFFASAITSASNSVVGSERLITKIYFPRLAIPFAAVGVGEVVPLNPLTGWIRAYRAASLGQAIAWEQVAVSATVAAAAFVAGCLYFRRVEDTFPDII